MSNASPACFHGGSFFEAIGERFDDLSRRHDVINADVLDAWFPPAPAVLSALQHHLDWLARTSPPVAAAGLQAAVAAARGLSEESVLVGAGSSDLIFLALREWLSPRSTALILDPMYGEYAHVLENVVRCTVDRFPLRRADGWRIDLDAFARTIRRGYDLVVIVNPNNPTGQYVSRVDLELLIDRIPPRTRVWIDEAYLEYVPRAESIERVAARTPNVTVCKSLSKVYALSGMRAAYLCASPNALAPLRIVTPPWAVSLPAQVAGVRALGAGPYYSRRYEETRTLRRDLELSLMTVPGIEQVTGEANFVLCHLSPGGPTAATVIQRCRAERVYLRDTTSMTGGRELGPHTLRTAVKDTLRNQRIVDAIARALVDSTAAPRRVTESFAS